MNENDFLLQNAFVTSITTEPKYNGFIYISVTCMIPKLGEADLWVLTKDYSAHTLLKEGMYPAKPGSAPPSFNFYCNGSEIKKIHNLFTDEVWP